MVIGGRLSRGGDRGWQRGSDGIMEDVIRELSKGGVELCVIRATVGFPEPIKFIILIPPTAVAKLLLYSGLRSNSGMGFLRVNDLRLA